MPDDSGRTADERKEDRKAKEERKNQEAARKADAVVIDLGRKSPRDVRDLRKGRGRLMDDVEQAIEELREEGAIGATAKPVIVVVERQLVGAGGMIPVILPPGLAGMVPLPGGRSDDDDDDDDDD
jgi:hypothetical protein